MTPNMDVDTEHEQVKALVDKYPDYFEVLTDRNKILCKLTKHELPVNATTLQTYIDGKKFQSFLKKVKRPRVIEKIDNKYKEYFIPSKKSPSRLFCTLTKKEINKLPHEIERYITGYKFLKAVDKDRERKKNGIENVVEETNENSDTNEVEDEGEEDEVPFFVLSSEDEGEEGDGDEGDDGEGDGGEENMDDYDAAVPNVIKLEESNTKNESTVVGVHEVIDDNLIECNISKNKKRKTKISRLKKEKKAKKIKPGV